MFYKIIEEYSNIIQSYSVSNYKKFGSAFSLVANIEFIDGSILNIKDYLFIDGKRKYSYHWQNNKGDLISRWDNSPHHKSITTFPHHRHFQDKTVSSNERNLGDIVKSISKIIAPKETKTRKE